MLRLSIRCWRIVTQIKNLLAKILASVFIQEREIGGAPNIPARGRS